MPILTYSSEIWLADFKIDIRNISKTPIEKIQNMILKDILGVHRKASNVAVLCELGIYPLCIRMYELMFKYYSRLQDVDNSLNNEILKEALIEDEKLSQKGNCPSIRKTLDNIKTLIRLESLSVSYEKFSNQLRKFFEKSIFDQLHYTKHSEEGKLLFFSKIYNYEFKIQEYLTYPLQKTLRSQLSKLRISAHPLNIEVGRYCQPPIPRSNRYCKFCINEVEDEEHFLLNCNLYQDIRDKFEESLGHFDIEDIINPVNYQFTKYLCKYLDECFKIRKENISYH